MLTFYYATNTCALASHIALEEAGADYQTRWIDFSAAEQTKPDYLKVNPKGRVPSLMTERGVLTETPAILAYIAQSHPEARAIMRRAAAQASSTNPVTTITAEADGTQSGVILRSSWGANR